MEAGLARLDPEELREYAHRDWGAPARLARAERARASVASRVRLAVGLYEAARAANPSWPDDQDRQRDLDTHRRVKRLLARAAHVGAR